MAFRRGPNMSQFNANLNLINPMYGTSEPIEDAFDQSNLDLFSNADFFDWEMGQSISTAVRETERNRAKKRLQAQNASIDAFQGENLQGFDINSLDLANIDPFAGLSNDFGGIQQPTIPQPQQQHRPIPPTIAPSKPQQVQQRPRNLTILPQPSHSSPTSAQLSSPSFSSPSQSPTPTSATALKRKSVALDSNSPQSLEEASRAAAEEDKRRRNTAASARFRIKKKQREQAMEKQAKELDLRVQNLDNKVVQLETENKWLRDLLMEKHGSNEEFLKMVKTAPFPLSSLSKKDSTDGG